MPDPKSYVFREQKLKGSEGASHRTVCGKKLLVKEAAGARALRQKSILLYSRNSKEALKARVAPAAGRN